MKIASSFDVRSALPQLPSQKLWWSGRLWRDKCSMFIEVNITEPKLSSKVYGLISDLINKIPVIFEKHEVK